MKKKSQSLNFLNSSKKEYNMGKIIQFPTLFQKERIGSKYRIKELELLRVYLEQCDEDMSTLLDQLDVLNRELLVLNSEYDTIIKRIKELNEIDNKE